MPCQPWWKDKDHYPWNTFHAAFPATMIKIQVVSWGADCMWIVGGSISFFILVKKSLHRWLCILPHSSWCRIMNQVCKGRKPPRFERRKMPSILSTNISTVVVFTLNEILLIIGSILERDHSLRVRLMSCLAGWACVFVHCTNTLGKCCWLFCFEQNSLSLSLLCFKGLDKMRYQKLRRKQSPSITDMPQCTLSLT